MEKQIIVAERQRFLKQDVMVLQESICGTFDELIRQAVGPGNYYSGFQAADTGQWEVTVSSGRIYINGAMYQKTADTVLSDAIFNARPNSQKKYVSIVGWGEEKGTTDSGAVTEPRQFLVNATTRETVPQNISTRKLRFVNVEAVAGLEAAQPEITVPGAGQVLIATVLLNASGIEAVNMNPDAVLPQASRNAVALAELSALLQSNILRLNTLTGDIGAINSRFDDYAPLSAVAALLSRLDEVFDLATKAYNLAKFLDQDRVTPAFVTRFEDDFFDESKSDPNATGYAALIKGGLRFPSAASDTLVNGIELFNPVDPKVVINNNQMIPAFEHTLRVDTFGAGRPARQASMLAYTTATQNIGITEPPETVWEWTEDTIRGIITQITVPGHDGTLDAVKTYNGRHTKWNGKVGTGQALTLHDREALREIFGQQFHSPVILSGRPGGYIPHSYDLGAATNGTYANGGTYTYWDLTVHYQYQVERTNVPVPASTTSVDVQGRAETFIQERDGILTQVGAFLSEKDASGDLRVLIQECHDNLPANDRVLAYVTVPHADLLAGPVTASNPDGIETKVAIPPIHLRSGRRYAVSWMTEGGHKVRMVEGVSHISQGEHLALTDANKWERPPLEPRQTMAYRLYFAKFYETRTEVILKQLSLPGGIHNVSVSAKASMPPSTDLVFEAQVDGTNWHALATTQGARTAASFAAAPELAPLRVVFEGTLDLMPILSHGASKSKVELSRIDTGLVHFTDYIDAGGGNTLNTVHVLHRLAGFDDTPHDVTVEVITDPGGTPVTEAADTVTDTVLPDGTVSRLSEFTLAGPAQIIQVKTTGACASAIASFSSQRLSADCYTV